MPYEPKPLSCDPAAISHLSKRAIVSHYESSYVGVVRQLNAVEAQLAQFDWADAPAFAIDGLMRERMMAMNSMVLHEVFFDSLGADKASRGLCARMDADFGGIAAWRAQFSAMGKALAGSSGWVVLSWLPRDGKLANIWVTDCTGGIVGAVPLLALDMYEHSYHADFGIRADLYVDTLMNNLNLFAASKRLASAAGL